MNDTPADDDREAMSKGNRTGGGVSRRIVLPTVLMGLFGSRVAAQVAPEQQPGADLLYAELPRRTLSRHQSVTTTGYVTPGRGAATYRLTTNQGETRFRFRSADGRWFELDEDAPDTFMFGGIGDGIHDDTPALRAQHDYCLGRGLPVWLPPPPVTWRTTDTINSRIGSWRGLAPGTRWRFDPPDPEAVDMRACLRIEASMSGVIADIDFQGPHRYDPAVTATYVRDPAQGPQSEDGGWYAGFFKPGCCAVLVTGSSQPIFRGVWTSGQGAGSFKVGLCLDTDAGHVEIGSGCRLYDLIGVRIVRNSDDYKFLGEPIITSGFCGILFGTSNLNGTFNGGLGMRTAEFYVGQCAYGVLQMHDHGPKGESLPNPALPVTGLYGTLDGSFLEFIGEAALQMLPTAVCRGLIYTDMERFSWDNHFALPATLIAPDRRQQAAFRIGQLSSNCQFGTVRSKPSYVSPLTHHPEACSILIHFCDANPSTIIAQPLLATTRIERSAPGASLYEATGRVLHAGDLILASELLVDGNLLHDPYDLAAWSGPALTISQSGQTGPVPPEMALELGVDPSCLVMVPGGMRTLRFVAAPDRSIIGVSSYITAWINLPRGKALFRLVVDDQAAPNQYVFTSLPTGGWIRLGLGGGPPSQAAALQFEIEVIGGPLLLSGLMASIGRPRPFNRADGPQAQKPFRALEGLDVGKAIAFTGMPIAKTVPFSDGASPLPATPAGYLQVMVNGRTQHIPFY